MRIIVVPSATDSIPKTVAANSEPMLNRSLTIRRAHPPRRSALPTLWAAAVVAMCGGMQLGVKEVRGAEPTPPPIPLRSVRLAPVPSETLPTLNPVPPITLAPMSGLTTNVDLPSGELPRNHADDAMQAPPQELGDPSGAIRTSAPFYSTPRIADFVNRPLYFEQRATERHGRSWGPMQPVVSGVQFFGTLPILPYKMGAQPPWQRLNTGNGVVIPSDRYTLRQHARGAIAEAGAAVGLIWILP